MAILVEKDLERIKVQLVDNGIGEVALMATPLAGYTLNDPKIVNDCEFFRRRINKELNPNGEDWYEVKPYSHLKAKKTSYISANSQYSEDFNQVDFENSVKDPFEAALMEAQRRKSGPFAGR